MVTHVLHLELQLVVLILPGIATRELVLLHHQPQLSMEEKVDSTHKFAPYHRCMGYVHTYAGILLNLCAS